MSAVNSSSDEKALVALDLEAIDAFDPAQHLRELVPFDDRDDYVIQRVASMVDDLLAEAVRLRAELMRKDQAIEDIRALAEKAFKTLDAPYKLTEFDFGHIDRDLREIQRLSGLSEHQEGNSNG